MLEEFKKYVSNYDMSNEKIKLKYNHSLRVMELGKKYAAKLGFSKEDIELAEIIGLLHDFGRFEQLKVYDSFDDLNTVDHADYSVEQLFEKGEITKYTKKVEDYKIIEFAIKNHNKPFLPVLDDERTMMHAKLIRDIDKIDIIYLLGKLGELNTKVTDEPLTPEIIDGIKKHVIVNRKYVKGNNDRIAINFGFVFDVYNDICLPEIRQNIEYYYDQINRDKKFKEIYEEIMNYIDNRIIKRED